MLEQVIEGVGLRLTALIALEDAAVRLPYVVGADILLVDLRGEGGDAGSLAATIGAIRIWSALPDVDLLAIVDIPVLEPVLAGLDLSMDAVMCDPSPAELAAELSLRAAAPRLRPKMHDIGREPEGVRIDKLSEEVRRLTHTIEQLTQVERSAAPIALRDPANGYGAPPSSVAGIAGTEGVTRQEVRGALQARRLRDRFLPGDLFADPAWDMILDLLAARLDGKRVSVSSLCIAAAVPPTTALRWITQLVKRGICVRRNDPSDARRVFISLSDEAAENVTAWFASVRRMYGMPAT